MLATAEALGLLLEAARRVDGRERIDTLDALNRVLAADDVSPLDVPHAYQFDGWLCRPSFRPCERADDAEGIATDSGGTRGATARRRHGGAPFSTARRCLPGADTVVMQEMATVLDWTMEACRSSKRSLQTKWIMKQGADIERGSVILPAGTRMMPQAMGLAASVGCATRETLRRTTLGHDLILACGGVSVGEEDHVKPAVEAEGRISMWQIAMKPGKPLTFGAVRRVEAAGGDPGDLGAAYFIGLPGNPVSNFCTFLLFVRPFLLRLARASKTSHRASIPCAPTSRKRKATATTNSCPRQRCERSRPVPEPELGRADIDRPSRAMA